jgi:hypothetical protein
LNRVIANLWLGAEHDRVASAFAELLTVGRGLPGGKSLSFVSPKESNPRKGDPDSPEFPKIKRVGWISGKGV